MGSSRGFSGIVGAFALLAACALASPHAMEAQQREGFIAGFGVGVSYNQESLYGRADQGSDFGVATDAKFGTMVGRSAAVYFVSLANFYPSPQVWDYGINRDVWVSAGLTGAGGSVFLGDFGYVDGALGMASFFCVGSFGGCDGQTGIGGAVGLGVALSETLFIDTDLVYGKFKLEYGSDYSTTALKVSLNMLSR